jgi:hypothetical protein
MALNFHASETGAAKAADEIRSRNGIAWTCKADISSVSEVRTLIRQVADHYKPSGCIQSNEVLHQKTNM